MAYAGSTRTYVGVRHVVVVPVGMWHVVAVRRYKVVCGGSTRTYIDIMWHVAVILVLTLV